MTEKAREDFRCITSKKEKGISPLLLLKPVINVRMSRKQLVPVRKARKTFSSLPAAKSSSQQLDAQGALRAHASPDFFAAEQRRDSSRT
jgi:hypothetical protein